MSKSAKASKTAKANGWVNKNIFDRLGLQEDSRNMVRAWGIGTAIGVVTGAVIHVGVKVIEKTISK
jgi:hypothetical protein